MLDFLTPFTPYLVFILTAGNLWLLKMSNDAKAERASARHAANNERMAQNIRMDRHERDLQDFKLDVVKNYATREFIADEFDSMNKRFDQVTQRIDRVLEKAKNS